MAAQTRTTRPPAPEACENLLQVIRSTAEPITATALARLLAPPHRIAAAALVPILDEYAAAGRLHVLPPATARGAPRYWDRDATSLIQSAAQAAVQQAERPGTARELSGRLGLPFKITEPELVPILNELVESGAIHAIAPATAKGKPRYWRGDGLEFGRLEILQHLEASGALPEARLRKAIKGLSDAQFRQIIQSAIDAREMWRHPPLGKSKHELLGKSPPSPEPYLRDVGDQLAQVVAQLKAAQVPLEVLRRSVVQLLESAGIEFAARSQAARGAASLAEPPSVDLIGMMRRLEPGADRGALVGSRDLRRAAQLDKFPFDQAVLELARQGRLSLHRHDYAASLSPAERDDLVTDGAGTYYVGMALRHGAG